MTKKKAKSDDSDEEMEVDEEEETKEPVAPKDQKEPSPVSVCQKNIQMLYDSYCCGCQLETVSFFLFLDVLKSSRFCT